MSSSLEDLVAYLAGDEGEAGARARASLADPDRTTTAFLAATQMLSQRMLGSHVVRWLGAWPEGQRLAPEAAPPPRPRTSALRNLARIGPWLLAAGACILAVLVWQDCRAHRAEPEPMLSAKTQSDHNRPEEGKQPLAHEDSSAKASPTVYVPADMKPPPPLDTIPGRSKEPPVIVLVPAIVKAPPEILIIPGVVKIKPNPEPVRPDKGILAKIAAAEKRIAELEQALEKARAAEKELETLRRMNDMLVTELQAANARAAQLKAEQARNKTLESSLSTANQKIAALTKELQTANKQIKLLNAEIKRLKTK